jgi:2-keto-3-deoxygluconate permease
LWLGGVSGVLLAVCALLIGGTVAVGLDVLLNRADGIAGIAASATGANAIAIPAAIALANREWQSVASTAAAQIGVAVLIGAIVVPFLAGVWAKRKMRRDQADSES